jgi:hypothetical protein
MRGDITKAPNLFRLVVSMKKVLNTTKTSANVPSTGRSAMSPIVTGIAAPPGLARICATIAGEVSMPCTSTPFAASGSAIRPVPMPSSSARPPAASSARRAASGSGSIHRYHVS